MEKKTKKCVRQREKGSRDKIKHLLKDKQRTKHTHTRVSTGMCSFHKAIAWSLLLALLRVCLASEEYTCFGTLFIRMDQTTWYDFWIWSFCAMRLFFFISSISFYLCLHAWLRTRCVLVCVHSSRQLLCLHIFLLVQRPLYNIDNNSQINCKWLFRLISVWFFSHSLLLLFND